MTTRKPTKKKASKSEGPKWAPKKIIPLVLLSAVDGATPGAVCSRCEIGRSTFYAWMHEETGHPAFREAVAQARQAANERTVGSLFANANGCTTTSRTKTTVVERILAPKNAKELTRLQDKGLVDEEGFVIVARTTEVEQMTQHKGETVAQIFWLCNRASDEWQHVNRVEGTGGGPIVVKLIDDVP